MVQEIVQHTQEWHEARRRCLTATDAAAVLGLHPYKSPAQVYMDKLGLGQEVSENDAMKTGTHLEPSIALWFGNKHGVKPIQANFVLHPEEEIFGASPDFLIGDTELLECKWCGQNAARGFGDGPDDVPAHYLIQVQWQLFVTGRKIGHLCVLGPWGFRDYKIIGDSELHRRMAFQLRKFWHEYIAAELPPPLSGSYGDKRLVEALHPEDDGTIIAASYELETEIGELGKELVQIDELSKSAEGRKNRIKQFMGDASILESTEGKFGWKKTKDSVQVDWQTIANELAQKHGEDILAAAKAHTQTKPGYRRFTTPFRTEKA